MKIKLERGSLWPFAAALVACSSPGSMQPLPAAEDFDIWAAPTDISVGAGARSPPITVSVVPRNGFTGSLTMSIDGVPAGVTPTPASPFSMLPGASQSVTFAAAADAPPTDTLLTFT